MVCSARTYATAFMNNIQIHAANRLYRYFKHRVEHYDIPFSVSTQEIYDTLNVLFNRKSDKEPNEYLLACMVEDFGNVYTFYNINFNNKYHEPFEFFYKLQKYNEINGLRNFVLIPQNHLKRHYIQLDSVDLYNLLQRNNLFGINASGKSSCSNLTKFNEQRDEWWKNFFNISSIETSNRKFRYMFQTDGYAVSISMRKPMFSKISSPKRCRYNNDSLAKDDDLIEIRKNISSFDGIIGLDPGMKLSFGGISTTPKKLLTNEPPDRLIKLTSNKFKSETKYYERCRKIKTFAIVYN